MFKITPQSLAEKAPSRWARQYEGTGYRDKVAITEQLKELKDITPEKINNIIGNSSWTRTSCDECDTDNVDVMVLGETMNDESATASICKECLIEALKEM